MSFKLLTPGFMNILSIIGITLILIPFLETIFRSLVSYEQIKFTLNADRRYYAFTRQQKKQLMIHRRKLFFTVIGVCLLVINLISNIIACNFYVVSEFLTASMLLILVLILLPLIDMGIYRFQVNRIYSLDMSASERNAYDNLRTKLEAAPFSLNGKLRQITRFLMFTTGIIILLIISITY